MIYMVVFGIGIVLLVAAKRKAVRTVWMLAGLAVGCALFNVVGALQIVLSLEEAVAPQHRAEYLDRVADLELKMTVLIITAMIVFGAALFTDSRRKA